jgi:hypothetical protein
MIIEFRKGKHKPTMVCSREDGSRTWRQTESYVLRDLAHYAVESNLCYDMGFYGLVNAGIDISDFTRQRYNPAEVPLDAFYAEHFVNLLLSEINTPKVLTDFQHAFDNACQRNGRPTQIVNEIMLGKIRSQVRELYGRWSALGPGEKLTLEFTFGREAKLP